MQVTAALVKELRERTGAGMMECKRALVETGADLEAAVELMRKSGQAKADKKAGRVAAEGLVAIEIAPDGRRGALVEVNCETDFVAKGERFAGFVAELAALALEAGPADASALGALALPDGVTVEERRRALVAEIGEHLALRRVALLEGAGCVAGYVHLGGRIGVLVALEGGDAEVARDVAMHVAASRPLALDESQIPPEVLDKEREILAAQVAESGKPPEIQEKMLSGRVAKYLKEVTLLGQPFVKDPDLTVARHVEKSGARIRSFVRFEVGEGIEKRSESFAEEVMAQVRRS
jgi:elongation factor Ts